MNRVLTDEQVQRLAVYLNEHADRLMPRDRLNRMDYTIVGMADGYRMVKGWLFKINVFSSPGLGTSFKFERMACKNVRNVELSRILDDYQCEILRSHIRVHMKNKLLDLEMNCSRPAVDGGPLNIRRLAEEERLNNNAMQQCMAESLRACREAEAMAYAANQLAVQTAINNTMLL